jgi:hypothetical protein
MDSAGGDAIPVPILQQAETTLMEEPKINKPPAFDPEKFRSKRGPDIANVSTLQQSLPILKAGGVDDYFRVHPDDAYRTCELCFVRVPIKGDRHDALHLIDEELAMMYLAPKQIKRFALCLASKPHDVFFLCEVPTQNVDNSYNRTALRAIEEARQKWLQALSRRDEGVDEYQIRYARDNDAFPEPKWPNQSIWDLVAVTFNGRTIERPDDPALLRLIGAKPPL